MSILDYEINMTELVVLSLIALTLLVVVARHIYIRIKMKGT